MDLTLLMKAVQRARICYNSIYGTNSHVSMIGLQLKKIYNSMELETLFLLPLCLLLLQAKFLEIMRVSNLILQISTIGESSQESLYVLTII
jgi:hypothetical protein